MLLWKFVLPLRNQWWRNVVMLGRSQWQPAGNSMYERWKKVLRWLFLYKLGWKWTFLSMLCIQGSSQYRVDFFFLLSNVFQSASVDWARYTFTVPAGSKRSNSQTLSCNSAKPVVLLFFSFLCLHVLNTRFISRFFVSQHWQAGVRNTWIV